MIQTEVLKESLQRFSCVYRIIYHVRVNFKNRTYTL